ncbi:MAG: carbamoyl-phosphate synthase large subunit, partial [Planctomycetes bacterium]|nr:carbamoyl-phosphate synthase large subunit [Planctomycetota bacterium]
MPKRADIRKILIIGSGPIVIGQACEFDYSGTQACKALKEEGFTLVLVNSNPATIMTDPEFSHRTYLEPLVPRVLARIIEIERPDALLPTIGGQTALNAAVDLAQMGVLVQVHVEMIGANVEAIRKAEDRGLFRDAMVKIGLDVPRSHVVHDEAGADAALADLGLPLVIRPAFTLGGTGGGIARQRDDYRALARRGLEMSPVREVLVEEALIGWKEFEMEVMRDRNDNVVIICSIENFDPMSVHTGDSITVAPAQTLTDKEMQRMRDASIACIREVGVDTGGSNIQFAVHPGTGRMVIIEMNPRVSRSSALASKATGYPIARIAAKLAVGYTLDEIPNDITRKTPASFEPAIDYVVTKAPRFTFEKVPGADAVLTTQMKSVGEAMAIGRTFKESFQKALRSLETAHFGLGLDRLDRLAKGGAVEAREVRERLATPNAERPWYLRYAFKAGMSVREMHDLTAIDPWFLENIREIVAFEETLRAAGSLEALDADTLREAKRLGFSDVQIATLFGRPEPEVRARRAALGVRPVYKLVDTCAAEFEAYTPYYYSTYEEENEVRVTSRPKIVVLGGGPNRIGQGIEFDYCCVHASFALRELGYESIMINSNPETVSTDYDTSDHLFFEPLTVEDVLAVCETVKAEGVIVQFGGQTPLNLAKPLFEAGVKIVGTSIDSIDRAE